MNVLSVINGVLKLLALLDFLYLAAFPKWPTKIELIMKREEKIMLEAPCIWFYPLNDIKVLSSEYAVSNEMTF